VFLVDPEFEFSLVHWGCVLSVGAGAERDQGLAALLALLLDTPCAAGSPRRSAARCSSAAASPTGSSSASPKN